MKVIVVGGGPSGLLAAIEAAKYCEVLVLEKMESFGKKLKITGKGRCNVTSSLPISEFISNVPGNGKFLYSAFQNFTNQDIIELLKEEGVEVKVERGNRIFPVSDKAEDVLNAILRKCKRENVQLKAKQKVTEIIAENGQVVGVKVQNLENNSQEKIWADKVILATGGRSYSVTGSTGDGYILAQKLGHNIIPIKPSLVPLESFDKPTCKMCQGLSLRNVKIEFVDNEKQKQIYEDFGEMLFTHFGISGPTILSGSAHLLRYPNLDEKIAKRQIELRIDLKPALDVEKLDARILRDFEENKNKQLKNSLDKLLPQKIIIPVIMKTGINPEKHVNEITREERKKLCLIIKQFTVLISGFRDIEEAIITSGGIDIKEINPKTMESKIIKGLFFAGEIIDVDAYTGGFNLQIAYSTGVTAGKCKERWFSLDEFLTIQEEAKSEIIVKKSKFISEVFYVETVKKAEETIQEIKKREYSAKHHCYAYRVLEESLVQKMSDDGEPSGTAGGPMLTVLQGKELVNVLVVVTRYFGGILLGTGGLVRAYSDATINAVEKAGSKKMQKGAEILLEIDYSDYESLKHYLKQISGKIILSEYKDSIKVTIQIPISYIDEMINYYQKLPFKIKNQKKLKEKFVDI